MTQRRSLLFIALQGRNGETSKRVRHLCFDGSRSNSFRFPKFEEEFHRISLMFSATAKHGQTMTNVGFLGHQHIWTSGDPSCQLRTLWEILYPKRRYSNPHCPSFHSEVPDLFCVLQTRQVQRVYSTWANCGTARWLDTSRRTSSWLSRTSWTALALPATICTPPTPSIVVFITSSELK